MPKLFDDEVTTGGDETFKINDNYATAYERWRQKEEYQKLKDKYGEDILSEDSVLSGDDESDESDESESLTEAVFDDEFLKVYGALKAKDPLIYDQKVRFFNKKEEDIDKSTADEVGEPQSKEKKKAKGMNLLEYHQNLVINEKGITEEDRAMENTGSFMQPNKSSYVQEMEDIKQEFKGFLENDDEDDLIKGVKKVPIAKTVSPDKVLREAAKSDERIGFLANYWNKKDLDNREKFLKDYIINKKYLDPTDLYSFPSQSNQRNKPGSNMQFPNTSYFISDGNIASGEEEDDEGNNEETNITEKLTNLNDRASYHFQENNADVIKRYPREVESVRNIKDLTTRNLKRGEVKERKTKEKQEALQRFRELRRAEVRAKLAKLKEISGNDRLLAEEEPDIDTIVDDISNFDPAKYDQCMSKLFDEKFYDVTEQSESIKKPVFDFIPGIDDVDDNLNPINQGEAAPGNQVEEEEEQDDGTSSKKNRKKKKKKAEKDPAEKKNIGIYEDVIAGEIPTRFRYREVPANDFGLSPEELLFADDKELNQWVSLKKTCQYRPMEEEKYDQKIYQRRANDANLKKKILKSLYVESKGDNEEQDDPVQDNDPRASSSNQQGPGKSRRSSKRKRPTKKSKELNVNAERLRSYDLSYRVIKKMS